TRLPDTVTLIGLNRVIPLFPATQFQSPVLSRVLPVMEPEVDENQIAFVVACELHIPLGIVSMIRFLTFATAPPFVMIPGLNKPLPESGAEIRWLLPFKVKPSGIVIGADTTQSFKSVMFVPDTLNLQVCATDTVATNRKIAVRRYFITFSL